MSLTISEIARAFSGHDFGEAHPYLADDVCWTLVGDRTLRGRAEVIGYCDASAEFLAGVTVSFSRFDLVVDGSSVVVDSIADYQGADGDISSVSSCDLYTFVDGRIAEIISYCVEVE